MSAADIKKIHAVFTRHPDVEKAILYGSRAKGTHRPGSDIDITLAGNISWDELQAITLELDDLMLPYQFDLSVHAMIDNPNLLDHIKRVGKTFYAREE
ncbi:nucleotidyltransferase domain-containing protein [Thiohalophilus sp.]|uniref:nucleotidyltransferase domain-containing protein n=1 Tax=Thiohalophilus sp. TaxID=3028392 RepID=UPI0039751ACD